ncbi:hypothetical protein ES703_70177 [subsurface metagenome]
MILYLGIGTIAPVRLLEGLYGLCMFSQPHVSAPGQVVAQRDRAETPCRLVSTPERFGLVAQS